MPGEIHDHSPILTEPIETNKLRSYRHCAAALSEAAAALHAYRFLPNIVNDIKGLQDTVEAEMQTLLIPPAP